MEQRNRIVWKPSVAVIVVVSVVIAMFAWISHTLEQRSARESARLSLDLNADAVVRGIERLMTTQGGAGVDALFQDLSRRNDSYTGLRLISHRSGEVVVSTAAGGARPLSLEDSECSRCHALEDPASAGDGSSESITRVPDLGRQFSLLTPIVKKPGCQAGGCHAGSGDDRILGFLQSRYSLAAIDPHGATRGLRTIGEAALAIVLVGLIIHLFFRRVLGRPIQELIRGTRRIAEGDLDFEFKGERNDEIGVLERSFNFMTSKLQDHQTELRNAMGYLEGIIESSADIIITVTPQHRIQTFNRGAEETLGYRREEIEGERIEVLFADPKDREYALNQLSHSDNVRNFRTDLRTKDGEIRHVLLTLSRLRDSEGNPIGTFGISKDVTEERKLIRQVIQSKKFAAIGEAVTGIQHAIKNMLNALKGGAYLVRNGIVKDNRQRLEEGWSMVEEGIERITALSLSLLNYAKEWQPDFEDVDLNHMATKVHEVIVQSAQDQGVTARLETTDQPANVVCDPKLIHMAIMDIVSNAIDACVWKEYEEDETPEVALAVFPNGTGDQFTIEIRDNGCGMSKVILENIFTPFFSTKKKWGTGLGLALTSRVINVHGGTVDVESEPGHGATFRIVLPTHGPRRSKEHADGQEGSGNR